MQSGTEDDAFRRRVAGWLAAHVPAELRGAGGRGRDHEPCAERLAWTRRLAAAGWTCLGWPAAHGGRDASLRQQMIFYEEYARSRAPARVAVVGEELLGPTLIAFGTPDQQRRFLPPIAAVEELWCQGYSEPVAGSDLAAVATTAVPDGDEWVISGQKVWTSLAHVADWCFVLARTEPGSRRSHGLSYLLVPMRQPGVTVRPIRQLTGTSEFNEVFFDRARTALGHVVGAPGDGWRIAKATLEFERGAGMLGQQVGFRRELDELVELARLTEAGTDPLLRDRLARAWVGLDALPGVPVRPPRRAGRHGHRRRGRRGLGAEGALVAVAPGARGAGDGRARRRVHGRRHRRRRRPGRVAAAVPVRPGRDHLRRVRRDPAEHHRRPCTGPAEAGARVKPPTAHSLLDGKVVVITAAAGTGIGSAAARRCLEEGAEVVISDQHARRLGETREEGGAPHGDGVGPRPCDVTDQSAVDGVIDGAASRLGRIDVLINNAGLGGTSSVLDMTDGQWLRVLDVTLNGTFRCTRAALRAMV